MTFFDILKMPVGTHPDGGAAWTGDDEERRWVRIADGLRVSARIVNVVPRWEPDIEVPWLDGNITIWAEVNGCDLGRAEVPVGCWADGTEEDLMWNIGHEGQKLFAALMEDVEEPDDWESEDEREQAMKRWGREVWEPYWQPLGELVQRLLIAAYRGGQKDE